MRKRSLETFSETQQRTDESPPGKRRNSGNETLAYLSKKMKVNLNYAEKS